MRLLALILFCVQGTLALCQVFAPPVQLTGAAVNAKDIMTMDVNQDGWLDVVSVSDHDDRLAWYPNAGDGTFMAQRTISRDFDTPRRLRKADLDNDGDLEILVLYYGSRNVAWFENLEPGLFSEAQSIYIGDDIPSDFDLMDINSDGYLDIVYTLGFADLIGYCLNTGSGYYTSPQTITDEVDGPGNLELADLDADGDLDLVYTSTEDDIVGAIYRMGPNLFSDQITLGSTGDNPRDVQIQDIDADGDLDIVTLSSYTVRRLLNDGVGGFASTQLISNSGDLLQKRLTIADLDQDNILDIALMSDGDSSAVWLRGLGDAMYADRATLGATGAHGERIISEDLDTDGKMDLLFAASASDEVYWMRNQGAAIFDSKEHICVRSHKAQHISTADLDGDGLEDVLSVARVDNQVLWYKNLGDGVFGQQTVIADSVDVAWHVGAADLDGDTDLDVYFASLLSNEVSWVMNLGSGQFGDPILITSDIVHPIWVEHLDLDNDGDLDLYCLSEESGLFGGTIYGVVVTLENNGSGDFSPLNLVSEALEDPYMGAVADLNGDGYMDLVTTASDGRIDRFMNDGTGQLSDAILITDTLSNPLSIAIADIDQDGDLDIVNTQYFSVLWYANDGDENFTIGDTILAHGDSFNRYVSLMDVEGDGDMDVMISNAVDDQMSCFVNSNIGQDWEQFPIEGSAISAGQFMVNADLDNDGDQDILSCDISGDIVAWTENRSGQGCLDPLACNYAPLGSPILEPCCYACGCTNPAADNYDPDACMDDGTCGFTITGTVYFDMNENGLHDSNEPGIPNQPVHSLGNNQVWYTNDEGNFLGTVSGSEYYAFTTDTTTTFPYYTSQDTLVFDAALMGWQHIVDFGISDEVPDFNLNVYTASPNSTYLCDHPTNHTIHITNQGNVTVDAYLQLTIDSLFQEVTEVSSIDSIVGQVVHMHIIGLGPGQHEILIINLNTPGAMFFGNYLSTDLEVWGVLDGDSAAYGAHAASQELTCAYDPNDKQVFPAGYTEAHYVPENDYLEYLIRFQNTGNAPATDVIVRDTLQPGLELSSFQLVANSHSVFTTVDPNTREIEFYFQDLQLPDSVNNEPESHGFVSFKIRPEEALPLLTELNNTAGIFFDNNPPIITNTTWSTLYDCSLFEVEFTQDGAILTASEGDSYQWYLDGEPIDGATAPIFEAFLNGEYAVEISNNFPCSDLTTSIFVLVDAIDELTGSPISLFPNPMTTSAIIDLGELRGKFSLEIYDVKGQLTRSQTMNLESGTLNLLRGDLTSGQYLLRLIQDDEMYERQFVVE